MKTFYLIFSCLLVFGLTNCTKSVAVEKRTGACNANDIKVAINPQNKKFAKQMDKCSSDAWGNAEKTSKCLKEQYPEVSNTCLNCYGQMAACGAANCKMKCFSNHFSEKCIECVNQNCRDEKKDNSFSLIKCTGLKANQLP